MLPLGEISVSIIILARSDRHQQQQDCSLRLICVLPTTCKCKPIAPEYRCSDSGRWFRSAHRRREHAASLITRDRRRRRGDEQQEESLLLEDDGRTLASYGIIGAEDGDDFVTLQFVVVAPLTAEQIEARSVEGRGANLN